MIGSALFNILWPAWMMLLAIPSLPLLALPRRLLKPVVRLWLRGVLALLAWTCGLTHREVGREHLPAGPFILAAKHQSTWETFALTLLLDDPAFVLKRELFRIPVFGWFLAKMAMIGIDRGAGSKALRGMVEGAKARAADGRPIVIFPQGTRMAPGERRPYLPGAYAIHAATGLPVVPAALNSGCFWPRRGFAKRPGVITLEYLPALPAGLDRKSFDKVMQDAIETATARLEKDAQGGL